MKAKKNSAGPHLTSYLTIAQYATKKNVARGTVYSHIKDNTIITEPVGMEPVPMIDWDKYKDYVFPEKGQRKTIVNADSKKK